MVAVGFWFDIFQVLNSGNNSLQSIPFSEARLTIGNVNSRSCYLRWHPLHDVKDCDCETMI